jgi:hypothetical protein
MGLPARDNRTATGDSPYGVPTARKQSRGTSTLPELYRASYRLSDASRGIYAECRTFGQPGTGTNGHPGTVIRPIANRQAK